MEVIRLPIAIVDADKKERIDNFNIASITGTTAVRRAGSVEFDLQSKSSGSSLGKVTVFINGYDSSDDKYYEDGVAVVNDSRTVTGETWFFDETGSHVVGDAIITKADGTKIAVDNGTLVPANTMVTLTGDYAGTYYVKADGTVAYNEIYTVDGVDRLFRENGTIVEYANSDVLNKGTVDESGKKYGTIVIAEVTYRVYEDNSAIEDDVLYDPQVTIAWPEKYNKGTAFTATYTGTVKSKNNSGAQQNISGTVTVTPVSVEATDKSENIEFTGTVDLSKYFKTQDPAGGKADNRVETRKYFFKDGGVEGISKKYTFKSVKKWNWPKELPVGTFSSITAVVTYSVEDMATQKTTTGDVETTATVTGPVVDGKNQTRSTRLS